MATLHLASWVNNLRYSDLTPEVTSAAVRSFYNWAGCAIGGSNHEATTIAYNTLSPFFGPASASLLGFKSGIGIDAQHAALLNGIASHVHDYDDTHLDTIIHPTGPVASALLAIAEWKGGIPGKDLLLALTVGIEAECKVGLGLWPEHYDVGWHITSTTGSIGAAAGVSKLLHLSTEQTAHAIGIAATQVVGLREMFGTHTKSFHPGRAAQNGLVAALLAQGGYTSGGQALEAKRGWANVVGNTKDNPVESLEMWLGTNLEHTNGLPSGTSGRWEILRNSFKPFPCGIVIHPVIDGCVQLHKEMVRKGFQVEDIDRIDLQVHPLVLELTGKKEPKDGLEGKFSVYHGAAIGILYGKATPRQYEDDVVQDQRVIAIREKSNTTAVKSLQADAAKILVILKNGATLERHVEHAVGSTEVPLTNSMLEDKFKDQCEVVLGDNLNAASDGLWNIENAVDVRDVVNVIQK